MPKKSKGLRYKRKKFKRTRRRYRGGNGETIKCCMCEKVINKDNTFVPLKCLNKHGKAAHRICQDCWWDPNIGFAREGVSHECPGCIKGLPLTYVKKEAPIYVDLTLD
jgi:hypothetical protein